MQQNNSKNTSLDALNDRKSKAQAEIREFFSVCLPESLGSKDEMGRKFWDTAKRFYPDLYQEVLEAKRIVESEQDIQSHGIKVNIWVSQSKKLIRLVTFRILSEYSQKGIRVIIE